MDENYLIHYGVKGMKWGVRRRKNKTSNGRRSSKKYKREETRKVRTDRKKASRNRRNLSDKELNDRIRRLENEKKLKKLTDEDLKPGRTAVKNFMKANGKRLASGLAGVGISAATGFAAFYLKNKISSKSPNFKGGDWQEFAKYVAPNPNAKKK